MPGEFDDSAIHRVEEPDDGDLLTDARGSKHWANDRYQRAAGGGSGRLKDTQSLPEHLKRDVVAAARRFAAEFLRSAI